MITFEIILDTITPGLTRLSESLDDPTPLMADLAHYMLNETKQNFAQQRGPDGNVWAPKSPVTIANYNRQGLSGREILVKEGTLKETPAVAWGPFFAEVFVAPLPYAAMMQFGGTKGQFPNLWGDIPARPYIGFAQEQEDTILEIVTEWLAGIVE
ncbi:phage virion morphogenesis protein [Tabrizicola sp.]|uniref:phage virion morphogenesis protein n=1 Tax=Tabrizicola sp. TaxID=2005166 RepID=UPI00286BB5D0|nr:phage virion morphogenesis protein [Tabrizicola sp.]